MNELNLLKKIGWLLISAEGCACMSRSLLKSLRSLFFVSQKMNPSHDNKTVMYKSYGYFRLEPTKRFFCWSGPGKRGIQASRIERRLTSFWQEFQGMWLCLYGSPLITVEAINVSRS